MERALSLPTPSARFTKSLLYWKQPKRGGPDNKTLQPPIRAQRWLESDRFCSRGFRGSSGAVENNVVLGGVDHFEAIDGPCDS